MTRPPDVAVGGDGRRSTKAWAAAAAGTPVLTVTYRVTGDPDRQHSMAVGGAWRAPHTCRTNHERTREEEAVLKRFSAAVVGALVVASMAACGGDEGGGTGSGDDKIVMGFAQVGAESGWRTANTNSIKDAAAAADIELKFSDAQQKQENQIASIRSY